MVPYSERKSFSSESTFQTDTIDMDLMLRKLRHQTAQLAFDLRRAGRLTARVTVKIRYTDFNTYTRARHIDYTAHDQQLIPLAEMLFRELFTRRQCIRLIGVRFDLLAAGHTQLDLFQDIRQDSRLLLALDKVRRRFGKGAGSGGDNYRYCRCRYRYHPYVAPTPSVDPSPAVSDRC